MRAGSGRGSRVTARREDDAELDEDLQSDRQLVLLDERAGFIGVNVTDTLTGYFAWRREALVRLRPHVVSSGFAIEMEMITKLARLGMQTYCVPITYDPRSGQDGSRPVREGLRILAMFARQLFWSPGSSLQEAVSQTGPPALAAEAVSLVTWPVVPTATPRPQRQFEWQPSEGGVILNEAPAPVGLIPLDGEDESGEPEPRVWRPAARVRSSG